MLSKSVAGKAIETQIFLMILVAAHKFLFKMTMLIFFAMIGATTGAFLGLMMNNISVVTYAICGGIAGLFTAYVNFDTVYIDEEEVKNEFRNKLIQEKNLSTRKSLIER